MRRTPRKINGLSGLPICCRENSRQIKITIGPGVTEEQIRIDLDTSALTVSITREGKVEKKAIRVPPGTHLLRKKFLAGIIEMILEKPDN